MFAIIVSESKIKETRFPAFPEEGMKKNLFLGENEGVVQSIDINYSNGSWTLMQSRNLSFSCQGKDIGSKQLNPSDLIQISCSNAQYLLYITNSPKKPMLRYHIPDNEKITIGTNDSNTIVYKAPLIAKTHVTISNENNAVSVKSKDKQSAFFLNGEKSYSSILSFGDIITILGLRIVYLGTMLAVNCPEELKECRLTEMKTVPAAVMEDITEEETDTGSYDSYFHRSPRIIKRVDQEPLKVDPPPSPVNMQQQPLFLRMGPSLLMGVAMLVNTMMMLYTNNSNPAALIGRIAMTGAMLAGMILWPIFTNIYYKINTAAKEKKRVKRYRQYMKKKFGEMEERLEDNRKILLLTYPDPTVCMNRVMNLERRIWERMPVHRDFLEVRIGTGTVPNPIKSNAPEDHFTMEDDYLLEELKEVNKAYLSMRDVSIPISLLDNKMVGFIGQRAMLLDIVMSLLVQISALHSYDEVKIFAIFPEHETDRWEWVKHLPHVWAPEKSARYVASNEEEVREVFSHLNEIIKQREEYAKESGGRNVPRLPHLVVLIAAHVMIKSTLP